MTESSSNNNRKDNDVGDTSVSHSNLEMMIQKAKSAEPNEQFIGVQEVRKHTSKTEISVIDDLIKSDILPILVDCLKQDDNPALQFEAAWILTNIAAGTSRQTQEVVNSGAVPVFLELLRSPHQNVCVQAVWALGNIIGDGPLNRDYVIQLGVVTSLINLIKLDGPLELLRNVAWAISNLCRNKVPPLSTDTIKNIIPALSQLINHTDQKVLADTVWANFYLAEGSNKNVQLLIDSGVVSSIVPLMSHKSDGVQRVAFRIVQKVITGSDKQVQAILKCNVLDHLSALLRHSKEKTNLEALCAIADITGGNQQRMQAVKEDALIPNIIHCLNTGGPKIQMKAAEVLINIALQGTKAQVDYLVAQKGAAALCSLLTVKDTQVVHRILKALNNILKQAGSQFITIASQIEKCGGLDKIEVLENHKNESIYKLAFEIVYHYF